MTLEELQVYSDMLADEDTAADALDKLEEWLKDAGQARAMIILLVGFVEDGGEAKKENRLLLGRIVSQLGGLVAHPDPAARMRAGRLLEVFADAASRLAGNPTRDEPPRPQIPTPGPVREALRHRTWTSGDSTSAPPPRRRPSGVGGIFGGSDMGIFGDSNDDD